MPVYVNYKRKIIEVSTTNELVETLLYLNKEYFSTFRFNRLCDLLQSFIDEFNNKTLSKKPFLKNIKHHLLLNGEFTNKKESFWIKRGYTKTEAKDKISSIQRDLSNKFHSKYTIDEKRHMYTTCKEYWIDKGYSETEAIKKISERQSTFSKEKCVEKYGKEEGFIIWKNRQDKWIKSLYDNNNMNVVNSKKAITLKNQIEKYGEKEGTIKYNSWLLNQQGKATLDSFINKYGEEDGVIRYNNMIDRMKYVNSISYYIEKYGEDEGTIKWEEVCKKRTTSLESKKRYSMISKELFDNITNTTNINNSYYAENEFLIMVNEDDTLNQKFVFPDFMYGNKIIEFYGDMWHMNPSKYDINDVCCFNKSLIANDIWESDKKRISFLTNKGYDVKIIWEHDYNNDKDKVIKECIDFLKN